MSNRIDSALRLILAPPSAVYAAFADPTAMEQWVPPGTMTATMLRFEFREGGRYRMHLSYEDSQPRGGKTSNASDEVEVHFIELLDSLGIVQSVRFESSDAAFAGRTRMTWAFDPSGAVRSSPCGPRTCPQAFDPKIMRPERSRGWRILRHSLLD